MSSRNIRKWLSEFKTIGKEDYSDYAAQVQQEEELIDELYDVFDEELSPEVIDPVCHQLFDFYRSLDVGLQRFALEFVPVLFQTYLMAVRNETKNDKKKYGGIEACLLGIYNIEAAVKDGKMDAKKVRIPNLAKPSIYHEPPSLAAMALTENALLHYHTGGEMSVTTGPMPQVESISSQNRLPMLTYVMSHYNAHISFMSSRSHMMLCRLGSKLSKSGFGSLDRISISLSSGSNRSHSSGHRVVSIADEMRVPLSSSFLIELLSGVYYTLFNGCMRTGLQALEDIHFRAMYELYADVQLVTNAIRNSLQLNLPGQAKDGPMGISIMLSPAHENPVFAKDAITNASFRAKKLPEDIDVLDEAGQLDTSFHDDGSEGDAVISLRITESFEKSKSSPLPKVVKGPLKSIMKKKEDKAKDRSHRKESDTTGASLSASSSRKGSHFKEFLEMHTSKSPKHSVSVSTGLSVSVNGDAAADTSVIPINIVRSSSSNRSVFEMVETQSAPKDGGRSSSQASSIESSSVTQDDTGNRGVWNGAGGKLLVQQTNHSRALNGATVMMDDVNAVGDAEEDDHVFTQL